MSCAMACAYVVSEQVQVLTPWDEELCHAAALLLHRFGRISAPVLFAI